LLEDGKLPELEERLEGRKQDIGLLPVMSVIRGLMKYQPSDRITVLKALEFLK
jgi:hypothetical protein